MIVKYSTVQYYIVCTIFFISRISYYPLCPIQYNTTTVQYAYVRSLNKCTLYLRTFFQVNSVESFVVGVKMRTDTQLSFQVRRMVPLEVRTVRTYCTVTYCTYTLFCPSVCSFFLYIFLPFCLCLYVCMFFYFFLFLSFFLFLALSMPIFFFLCDTHTFSFSLSLPCLFLSLIHFSDFHLKIIIFYIINSYHIATVEFISLLCFHLLDFLFFLTYYSLS